MTKRATPVPAPSALSQYVEEHPVGAVVAAFGVGYVVSGALFSKATVRLVGFGLQQGLGFVAPTLIRAALQALAETGREDPVSPAHKKESP